MDVSKNHWEVCDINLIILVMIHSRYYNHVPIQSNKIWVMEPKAVSFYSEQKVIIYLNLESTKKYLLAALITKLKDFLL